MTGGAAKSTMVHASAGISWKRSYRMKIRTDRDRTIKERSDMNYIEKL